MDNKHIEKNNVDTRESVAEDVMQDFKDAVKELCIRYNVSIGHEDSHGAFHIINGFDERHMEWFMDAYDPNKRKGKVF